MTIRWTSRVLFLLVTLVGIIPSVAAQTVSLGAGYQGAEHDFANAFSFIQYLEPALVDASYRTRNGPVFDGAVCVPLRSRLAVVGGASVFLRSGRAQLASRMPHPFFFSQPRDAELALDDVRHREVAGRVELAWVQPVGNRWQVTLSGGPAFVWLMQGTVQGVRVREAGYPFDAVAIEAPDVTDEDGWAAGGTVGLDLTFRATPHVGVGVATRFTRATVELEQADVTTGGPMVTVGLRWRWR